LQKFPKDKLIGFLLNETHEILVPALRIVSNVCMTEGKFVSDFMDTDILKAIKKIITNENIKKILKECCLITYNFAIGPTQQITSMIETGVFETICSLIIKPGLDPDIFKEAANAMATIISGCHNDTVEIMLKSDLPLQAITKSLDISDIKTLSHVLSALEVLLGAGNNECNEYATNLDAEGGVSKLTELQNHANSIISSKAKKILDRFYYVPASVEYQIDFNK